MADKTQVKTLDELGDGIEVSNEIPDELLEGVVGGAISDPVCSNCGTSSNSFLSGPDYYGRYCQKCGISWPYYV